MSNRRGSGKEKQARPIEIDCFACRHFLITHNPGFPYGCRAAGFKSRFLPTQEMYRNSGLPCQLFAPKGSGTVKR